MKHERTCPECGAAFVPRHHSQACCSDACKRERNNRLSVESRTRCNEKKRKAAADARTEKARRRAAFFAARDAAWEAAGLPIPKIEVRNGIRIERRGTVPAGGHAADFIRHT